MIEFAVNYSPALAGLVRGGQVRVDRYKCPAWPDLLATAAQSGPVYIHFPYSVGGGQGLPQDEEKKQPVDFARISDLLAQTGTPLVNTHLMLPAGRYPGIPLESRDPRHLRRLVDSVLRDLDPLLERFGPERVIVENVVNEFGWLTAVALPEVLHALLERAGCGFLLDLSHARLAARNLGIDELAYVAALPVERIREVHITGLQRLEGDLLERMRAAGDPLGMAKFLAGKDIDHMPMQPADWPSFAWLMDKIYHAPGWGQPWVVGYEYGGVGAFWEDVTRAEVYLDQLPRMAGIVHGVEEYIHPPAGWNVV